MEIRLLSGATRSLAAQDHGVLFYERAHDLVTAVTAFVAAALEGGNPAVIVATPEHRRAIAAALGERGIDVAAADRDGQFVALDAYDTLAQFCVDGILDAQRFDAVIGDRIRSAAAGGREVAVFGEMVALLWAEGDVAPAIELEALWNGLRANLRFALLCGYPSHALVDEKLSSDVLEVCHLHSHVAESQTARRVPVLLRVEETFAGTPEAARGARQFVRRTLLEWRRDELVAAGALAVTELVSNAVVHAQSDLVVRISCVRGAVRIAVHDASSIEPVPREASAADASGRGLALVAALASRWGTELEGSGKTVWVELAASPANSFTR